LAQDVTQTIDLIDHPVALGEGRVALGKRAADQDAQRVEIVGKGIGQRAHDARIES